MSPPQKWVLKKTVDGDAALMHLGLRYRQRTFVRVGNTGTGQIFFKYKVASDTYPHLFVL
jgi:hypothetical protein